MVVANGGGSSSAAKVDASPTSRLRGMANSGDGAIQKSQLIIRAFPLDGSSISLSALARRAGLAKSTTHRTLGILEETGVVERGEGAQYRLGMNAVEIVRAFMRGICGLDLRDRILPYLIDLHVRVKETVYMGVLWGQNFMCSEVLYGRGGPATSLRQGSWVNAWNSAAGKILLANSISYKERDLCPDRLLRDRADLWVEINRIKRAGVAITRGEEAGDTIHLAAPVYGEYKLPLCAIALCGDGRKMDIPRNVDLLKRGASGATMELRSNRSNGGRGRWRRSHR